MAVRFVHNHQVGLLAATQLIWLLSLAFVFVRSRRNGGVLLESAPVLYFGFSVPFYVVGLLFASGAYAIF